MFNYFCSVIVVTGALGFIGSALLGELSNLGYGSLVAVDDFSREEKWKNLETKDVERVERSEFLEWMNTHASRIQFIFHIGARTKTNEFNWETLESLNIDYTKSIWKCCAEFSIPLIYASSAATYGDGTNGFDDSPLTLNHLKPLNPYGKSKHIVDQWVLEQEKTPPFWAGFKFFNVFGPNEYHKGRMASVVFHAFHQISESGGMKLFKSYRDDYADGEQKRDFIYIKDVISVMLHFMHHRQHSGIYNLGTGSAHTFLDLANGVFKALDKNPNIEFIEMPEDIRGNYQYFTEASMERIRQSGYEKEFWNFHDAIADYVKNYLLPNTYM